MRPGGRLPHGTPRRHALPARGDRELALDEAAPHGGLYERRFSGEVRPWQGPPLAAADEEEEMGEPEERARWVMIAVLRWPA